MRPSGPPQILEWYRADSWPRMRRILLTGPCLVTLGGIVVSISIVARPALDLRVTAALVGFLLIGGGALATMVGMHRILRDDRCLSLRTDGILIQSPDGEVLAPWDTVERARWDPAMSALIIELRDGAPIVISRRFVGVDGLTLAGRIESTRRRVAMSLAL